MDIRVPDMLERTFDTGRGVIHYWAGRTGANRRFRTGVRAGGERVHFARF